jgi:hypothetical protein
MQAAAYGTAARTLCATELRVTAEVFFTGIMPTDTARGWQALFHRVAEPRQLDLQSASMQRLHDEWQAHAQAWKTTQASSAARHNAPRYIQAIGREADTSWYVHTNCF